MIPAIALLISLFLSSVFFVFSCHTQKIELDKLASTSAEYLLYQNNAAYLFCHQANSTNCQQYNNQKLPVADFLTAEEATSPIVQSQALITVYYSGLVISFINPNLPSLNGESLNSFTSYLLKIAKGDPNVGYFSQGDVVGYQGKIGLKLPNTLAGYDLKEGTPIVIG